MANAFRNAYDLAFQVSPIIFHNGIARSIPGAMLPIIGLVGSVAGFLQAKLTGSSVMDSFFARFVPVPGSNIINNAVGMYPFANQQVAANAIITSPTKISLLMIAPVKAKGGYATKLAIMTALKSSFENHNALGGTYHVATPAYIYTDCIMTGMTDVTEGTKQQQIQWKIDFIRPLVSRSDAKDAFSALMSKVSGGSKITKPAWSGAEAATGASAQGATAGSGSMVAPVIKFLSGPL